MRKENTRQHTLYFLSFITGLIKRCRVKSTKKDKWPLDSKPYIGELELRIQESRGGKDHPCDEAKSRVAELKALREAKRRSTSKTKKKFSSPLPIPIPATESVQLRVSDSDNSGEKPRGPHTRNHLEEMVNALVNKRVKNEFLSSSIKFLTLKNLLSSRFK